MRDEPVVAMTALSGLAVLLLLQAAGEGLTHAFALPFPGPVVGLVLLLLALNWPLIREPVAAVAELLLANLSLLFVPVGVGVIAHLQLVSRYGVQLLVVIVLSTWIGMAVTAIVLRQLLTSEPTSEPTSQPTSEPTSEPKPESQRDSAKGNHD